MPYDLYGKTEQAREALWAAKEDAKAIEALRRRYAAESDMQENVASLNAKQGNA